MSIYSDIVRLVERNRAAGTVPYYVFRDFVRPAETPGGVFQVQTVRSMAQIGNDRVWTVGVDPLGEKFIALPADAHAIARIVATALREMATGAGTVTPFRLGLSELGGPDVLGGVATDAITLTDSVTSSGGGEEIPPERPPDIITGGPVVGGPDVITGEPVVPG